MPENDSVAVNYAGQNTIYPKKIDFIYRITTNHIEKYLKDELFLFLHKR